MNKRHALLPLLTVWAAASVTVAYAQATPRTITLEAGQQRTWTQNQQVRRVATADDEIVGVNVAPPRGIIITAKQPGTAMVSVWEGDSSAPTTQVQVVVSPSRTGAKLSLSGDGQQTQLTAEGPRLRLSGSLSSLERHAAIESALQPATEKEKKTQPPVVDTTTSAFDVQVQIDIKIVEVSRQQLEAAGFYWDKFKGNKVYGMSGPNNLSGLQTQQGVRGLTSSTGFLPKLDAFNIFRWGTSTTTIFAALEANGFAYTLAEPSLTALSGQTATFLAGGEIPIPLRTGTGAESSVTVQFKEFGIRLGLTPTVLDQNRIALRVAPEVSEIDESLSITLGGLVLPGLRVRRTETTVAMGDGETFVVSGLVSRATVANVDKFPLLGDIPILGAFFRSTRFNREDKELLMIATPRLVRPFAKTAKLPELPGEEVRDYKPDFMRFWLKEDGRFNQDNKSGFSQ